MHSRNLTIISTNFQNTLLPSNVIVIVCSKSKNVWLTEKTQKNTGKTETGKTKQSKIEKLQFRKSTNNFINDMCKMLFAISQNYAMSSFYIMEYYFGKS